MSHVVTGVSAQAMQAQWPTRNRVRTRTCSTSRERETRWYNMTSCVVNYDVAISWRVVFFVAGEGEVALVALSALSAYHTQRKNVFTYNAASDFVMVRQVRNVSNDL